MPDKSDSGTNLTLYAHWKKNPVYTVTYNANGADTGTIPSDYFQYQTGSTVTVQDNRYGLTRAGYSFIGWCVNANGTGASYSKGQYLAIKSENVVLYAKWSAQPAYSVTYNANGADSGAVPSDGTLYESGALVTVDGNTGGLSKTGYTFAGWCVNAGGIGTSYIGGKTFTIGAGSVTLYAKWEDASASAPTYTVSYSAKGAATSTAATPAGQEGDPITPSVPIDPNLYHENDPVTVFGNVGNALNPGNLVKSGYSFKGWSLNEDGSGTTRNAGDLFRIGASNVTLYSAWTLIPTYTVTYSLDGTPKATGGNAPVDQKAYKYRDTVTVLAPVQVPTLYGYTFHGWSPYADGSLPVYSQGQTFSMGNENVTLYVAWTKDPTYKVMYDPNGATSGSVPVDGSNYLSGQTATVLTNCGDLRKSPAGDTTIYSFAGWNTAPDGSGTTYGASGSATVTMRSSNVTLYARWSSTPTYPVHYEANAGSDWTLSGSVPLDISTYMTGQTVTLCANTGNLAREGYYFKGWSLSSSNNVGTLVRSVVMGTSATTLYAVWSPKSKYTVTYYPNGNTSSNPVPSPFTAVEGTRTNIAFTPVLLRTTLLGSTWNWVYTPSQYADFILSSWNTSADGSGTTYDLNQSIALTQNLILYAQYTILGSKETIEGGTVCRGQKNDNYGWSYTVITSASSNSASWNYVSYELNEREKIPTLAELQGMYSCFYFTAGVYWSSEQYGDNSQWCYDFSNGQAVVRSKTSSQKVVGVKRYRNTNGLLEIDNR